MHRAADSISSITPTRAVIVLLQSFKELSSGESSITALTVPTVQPVGTYFVPFNT